MRKREDKKTAPLRRALRWLRRLVLGLILLQIAACYAPFALLPALDADTAAAVEARVDEMQRDIETGDRAMLLESSQSALEERLRLIGQARREVVIVTYECHDGESTRDILAAALERAAAGVRVRILVDGIAGRLDHMGGELFCAAALHPNVEIRFYNLLRQWTPWKHMGRMHDKYVIVDDTAYVLGGRNMFDKFIGSYPTRVRSLDREALVYNSDGAESSSLFALREYFEGMWAHPETVAFDAAGRVNAARCAAVTAELSARLQRLRREHPDWFEARDYAAMTEPTGGVWLVSNPTGIYAKQPVVFATLCALTGRARREVTLHSPYAVLNGDMRDALSAAAARVPVTLMVNAVENGANLAASGDYLYHRREVIDTGVRLLEYAGGISYHGKAAAIDGDISVIGSFNMDMRSAYVDTELMLVIRSPQINAQLRGYMEALHAGCRRVVDPDTAIVPEGLDIPALPLWKRAALYAIGALLQPVRHLV